MFNSVHLGDEPCRYFISSNRVLSFHKLKWKIGRCSFLWLLGVMETIHYRVSFMKTFEINLLSSSSQSKNNVTY